MADARHVAAVARLAETDRSVRRLADLCRLAGLRPRTLQRMFLRYAGVSPTWVLRRYRLLDAAEAVRDGRPVSWAEIAAGLGYADQAHLITDFRAAVGQTRRPTPRLSARCGSRAVHQAEAGPRPEVGVAESPRAAMRNPSGRG